MDITWNPETIPDNEDAVVLTAHPHASEPTKVLGHFSATQQVNSTSVEFGGSGFGLSFRDAYIKAKAYAQERGIKRLYVVDPLGMGAHEVRDL